LVGGDVVVAINDDPVADMLALQAMIANHELGDEVTLRIIREGDQLDIHVILDERP